MTTPRGKRIQRYAPSQVPSSTPAELRTWLTSEFRSVAAVQTNAEWDNVAEAPDEFPPAPHQHDWSDIYGEPSEYPPAPHTHVEADIVDLDRLRWRGIWAPGAYVKNDLVRDGRWLTAARVNTTAEPVVEGAQTWFIVPEPVWTGANTAGVFGVRITGTERTSTLSGVRIKARQSGEFNIWLAINGVRVDLAIGIALVANVWREFYFQPMTAPAGSTLDIVASGGSYNQAVDYFAAYPNVRGFRGPSYPPTPAEMSDDAFGIDFYYFPSTVSPDWEVL